MVQPAPVEPRYTSQTYFDLVETGVLRASDRVELLEGVIVAMSPQSPPHAAATSQVDRALREAAGRRAAIRVQLPFVAGGHSVPEPDVAVVPGTEADYATAHPTTALLIVEVADSSLLQDRLTKTAIYAAAAVPEYWIINLRDDCVEVFRTPDAGTRSYRDTHVARRGQSIQIVGLAAAGVQVDDLLPSLK